MSNQGIIIGLTGPSGVGKGFIKDHLRSKFPELTELTVQTTRARRPSDGFDRETDIPLAVFLQKLASGEIVFAHQPFESNGHWYGFVQHQIDQALHHGDLVLTEVHVDNVQEFKRVYGSAIILIGLTADETYLEQNIKSRATESQEDQISRLKKASRENSKILEYFDQGLLNAIVSVRQETRGEVGQMVQAQIELLISTQKNSKETK